MNLLNISIILGMILSSPMSSAFSPWNSALSLSSPSLSHMVEKESRIPTFLPSTLVDEIQTTTLSQPQQYTDEEQLQMNYISQDAVKSNKSYLDDGFVFGLDGSGLDRPKGKTANVVVEGDSLVTTPLQVGFVSATFAGHALFAANAIHNFLSLSDGNVELTAMTTIFVTALSWIIADFGSGVLHWSVDNYGNGRTPVMGNIIAAFQGHHSAPWTITQRGFCNNVWKLCIPFGVPTVGAITYLAGSDRPMVSLFFAVFCAFEIMSQEMHKWSHMTKKEVPSWVNTLMDLGVTIGRVPHAKHHLAPYAGNYCIVSGYCNEVLDNSGVFRLTEHIIYEINGVESNSMKLDPELKARTLKGEYKLTPVNKK